MTYRELTENYLETRSHADYTALYRRVKPGLVKHAMNIIKDRELAEDIAVNTLIKLWTKIDQYDPQYQISTWLYRIAFNEALGIKRERDRRVSMDRLREDYGVEISSAGGYDSLLEDMMYEAEMRTDEDWYGEEEELNDKYESALKAIRDLKPLYRDILIDRLIHNMKYKDIAVKHKIDLQTVKNRIRRGRTLIAESIKS